MSYCCVRASSRVLTSKIRDRPLYNILDEPLGGRKRGPDRVMGLDWGLMVELGWLLFLQEQIKDIIIINPRIIWLGRIHPY